MAGASKLTLLIRQHPVLTTQPLRYSVKQSKASLTTLSRGIRPAVAVQRSQLARTFAPARSYADGAPKAELSPNPPKKKRGRFRSILLWTWRLTYLSAIGGLIYVGYGIYEMREPPDQEYPDPAKKTLVILGETAH
jgi:hypothetical protein